MLAGGGHHLNLELAPHPAPLAGSPHERRQALVSIRYEDERRLEAGQDRPVVQVGVGVFHWPHGGCGASHESRGGGRQQVSNTHSHIFLVRREDTDQLGAAPWLVQIGLERQVEVRLFGRLKLLDHHWQRSGVRAQMLSQQFEEDRLWCWRLRDRRLHEPLEGGAEFAHREGFFIRWGIPHVG